MAAPAAEVLGVVDGDVVAPAQISLAERVHAMQQELDLPEAMVSDLLSVSGADIVVIADDSGSMNAISDFKAHTTRWDELKNTLTSLAKMLLVVDHADGFHVQFLNDATWHEIHRPEEVVRLFTGRSPHGTTPLMGRMQPVLDGSWHPKGHGSETDVLMLVMTDGVPSDTSFDGLRKIVRAKHHKCFVSFLMCTDEDAIVENYNKYMDSIPGVDITDDFLSEQQEAAKYGRKLSYFKWLAKAVLGGKMPKYDKLDEGQKCKCAIS